MNRLQKFDLRALLSRSNALQLTFGCSCLILLLLQLWRPYYFLQDDNLIYWFPLVHSLGDRLSQAQSPFVDPYLFGGYRLLSDPSALSLWNPLVLGLSLLANTPFHLAITDLFASANLLLSALAFALLLRHLRDLKGLQLSEGRIAFLSLSLAFSSYAINVGACWAMFLANQASLPIMLLGLFAVKQRTGILWVAGGVVYGLLVGHLSPFLYSIFFVSLLVCGLCWADRSWQPLVRWMGGVGLALLIALPVLIPAALSFFGSPRNAAFTLKFISEDALPFPALVAAYFAGNIGLVVGNSMGLFARLLIYGVVSSAANWAWFGSLRNLRALSRLEIAVGAVALIVALFMSRPHWLGVLISHVPLYRSLRWPFREAFLFLFLAHLWIALRPNALSPRASMWVSGLGAAIFLFSLALIPPWSLSPMKIDRKLIISGQAAAHWRHVKSLLGPQDRIMAIVPRSIALHHDKEIPYSLIGALNYPAFFRVPSISGYTAPGLEGKKMAEEVPYFFGGIYSPEAGTRLLLKNKRLKALKLVSLQPLRIDLCSGEGCDTLPTPPISNATTP